MADEPENQASANIHIKADRQRRDTIPSDHALAEGQAGKGRVHRPKLSLRYRSQTLATDL
ncbi:MAG: hypothetical protein IE921_02230 [Rhodobacteraceae bacterium]|nr:hypothetical protein [Paracoccaceae bacterium]